MIINHLRNLVVAAWVAASFALSVSPSAAAPGDLLGGGSDPNSFVNCVVTQQDGKVLVAGNFTIVGGASRNHIARLSADMASVDGSFDPNVNGIVESVAVQKDGQIIIVWHNTAVGSTPVTRRYIARINNEATLYIS